MTIARRETLVEGENGLYHCISRCVRRAFLCGIDPYSGKSFEHRKAWVQSRLELLASVFAIDVYAFAVMSNHLHAVLRNRPDLVESWDDQEVVRRWRVLFPKKNARGPAPTDEAAIRALSDGGKIPEIRLRLSSISWFMRCLNEPIARRANIEDDCKGRFWEGRYKCQALLDEGAVLACMAYVDLNPVRAGLADTPETSLFTSAHLRISSRQAADKTEKFLQKNIQPAVSQEALLAREQQKIKSARWLCPLGDGNAPLGRGILSLGLDDYLNILDWTGRQLRNGSKSAIPNELGSIITRLDIDRENWLNLVESYGGLFYRAVGKVQSLREAAEKVGRRWLHGLKASRAVFLGN
ncbi:MAG: transposase [Pseudomonadota bacterium]